MKKGDVVHLVFLDHSFITAGAPVGPVKAEVFGRVLELNKSYVVVGTWVPVDENPETVRDNTDCHVIVRSAILKTLRLSGAKRK